MTEQRTSTGGDARFRFRDVGKFVALGVAGGVVQVGAGLYNLRNARSGRGPLAWIAAAGLAASGVAQIVALLSCRRADVRLTDHCLVVRVGWLWRYALPHAAIGRVGVAEFPLMGGFGIRTDFRGTVAVALWGVRAVALELEPPRVVPVFSLRERMTRQLWLGVEDEEGFMAAVQGQPRPSLLSG